jgi:hypothetical protein
MVYIPKRRHGDNGAGLCFYGEEGSAGGEQSSAGTGRGGYGGNRGEGSGPSAEDRNRRNTARAPDQYIDVNHEDFNYQSLEMGGKTGAYNTKSPNYGDLTAKHQAGYKNPETGATEVPNMFNFNGTVYNFNPDDGSYKDTYSGTTITQDNGETGRLGIEGIYGQYNPGAYQRDMGGIDRVLPQITQTLNPAYTQWEQEQAAIAAANAAAIRNTDRGGGRGADQGGPDSAGTGGGGSGVNGR